MKIDAEKFKEILDSRGDEDYIDEVVNDCMKIVYKRIFETAMKQNIDKLDSVIIIYDTIYFVGDGDNCVQTTKPISKEIIVDKMTNILKDDGYQPDLTISESSRRGQYINFWISFDNRKDVVDEIN